VQWQHWKLEQGKELCVFATRDTVDGQDSILKDEGAVVKL